MATREGEAMYFFAKCTLNLSKDVYVLDLSYIYIKKKSYIPIYMYFWSNVA
jgi:hypothetical protein